MKHYIPELIIHNHVHLKKLQEKHEVFTIFICMDGQYQMIGDTLYKYKIPSGKDTIIKDYIDNYTLLSSEKELLDMSEEHWRLPPENITKEINKYSFTIHPQSQTAFVIERSEDKITDYYFESPHTSHQKTLKEDISSLLSYLK